MIIVLGGSGFLGPALRAAAGKRDVVLTHRAHPQPESVHFDAKNGSVADLIDRIGRRPAAVVIAFGVTNIDACARDPAGTAAINVEAIVRVIDELRVLGIVPVFTSSDAVFDGSHGMWREDEVVRSILTYGRQKLEVESYLASLPPPWLAVRLPKLLSARRHSRCMLTDWVDALGRAERILCATDQFFTPAEAGDAAKAILRLVEAGESGLFHLGGAQRLSRRELLEAVVDEYRKFATPRAAIEDCALRDIPFLEPRPLDLSMDTSRYVARFGDTLRPAAEIARLAVRDCFAAAAAP